MKNTNAIKKNKRTRNIKALISCSKISKSYEFFEVLKSITFSINKGERVGLIGANGSGKSTLLKILARLESFDDGNLEVNGKVGYLPQGFTEEEGEMNVLNLLGRSVKEVLPQIKKFGLNEETLNEKIKNLSGGEKNKISIVRILLSSFNILLLDEPTNNLDFQTLEFLESFIKRSNKTFLIISHDREFLDRTVSKMIEIDGLTRESRIYDGGFTKYLESKQVQIEKEWSKYKDAQSKSTKLKKASDKKIKDIGAIEKTLKNKSKLSHKITDKDHLNKSTLQERAGKKGRQAKVLRKRLERQQKEELQKPKNKRLLKLKFEKVGVSGNKVFELKNIFKKINNFKLGPINLKINHKDRLLIVGSNGSGKSTLIKLLMGIIKADQGTLEKGSRLNIGYLPQESNFDFKLTLLEQFLKITNIQESDARKILNRFRLKTEDINKKITELSPGEKSRLMLASMMYQNINCLILDEPSNHLDFEVLDSLEKALRDFQGTLIITSHDRYFY